MEVRSLLRAGAAHGVNNIVHTHSISDGGTCVAHIQRTVHTSISLCVPLAVRPHSVLSVSCSVLPPFHLMFRRSGRLQLQFVCI